MLDDLEMNDTNDSHSQIILEKSNQIKRHVIQLEVITLSTILFIAISYLKPAISDVLGTTAAFLSPFPFLALIPWLAPVVNPEDDNRSRLKWGLSGLGTGATIGGGITGTLTGGLLAPAGALVGGAIGFVTGVIIGPTLDGNKQILTQGEAREYMILKRKKFPSLDMQAILDATEYPASDNIEPIRMFKSDGIIKCAKDDLIEWLKREPW